jgi:hypothetical protein
MDIVGAFDVENCPRKQGGDGVHAIRVLEEDHDRIENLLERLAETNGSQDRARLSERLENELLVHTLAEDNIFLPHVEEAIEDSEKTTAEFFGANTDALLEAAALVAAAYEDQQKVRELLEDLDRPEVIDDGCKDILDELREAVSCQIELERELFPRCVLSGSCPQLFDVTLRTIHHPVDQEGVGVGEDLRRYPGGQPHHHGEQLREEPSFAGIAQERALALHPSKLLEERERDDLRIRQPLEGLVASGVGVEESVGVVYEQKRTVRASSVWASPGVWLDRAIFRSLVRGDYDGPLSISYPIHATHI